MHHRDIPKHAVAKHARSAVLENIERHEALPASVTATDAFECVIGSLVQRLPSKQAAMFVERHLPRELSALLATDVEEALDEGVEGDLAEYVDEVAGKLEIAHAQARELVDVVIGSLRVLMSAEEVEAVADALSPQLAKVWIEASHVPGAPGYAGRP